MATSVALRRRFASKMEYDVNIFGENILSTVTMVTAIVTTWIEAVIDLEDLPARRLVGLDALWRPSSDPRVLNPMATLQLSFGRYCLVYQILESEIPSSLVDFLADRTNVFVGVGIAPNLEKLVADYHIGETALYIDLGTLAAVRYCRPELQDAGLRELANFVLEKDYEEPAAVCTDWDEVELTDDQVLYASIYPFVSSQIAKVLM